MNEAGEVVHLDMRLDPRIVDALHGALFEAGDDLLDRVGHPAMVNEAGTDG